MGRNDPVEMVPGGAKSSKVIKSYMPLYVSVEMKVAVTTFFIVICLFPEERLILNEQIKKKASWSQDWRLKFIIRSGG